MSPSPTPLDSLHQARWFKLIGGASFQHLPAIRSLALAYALAGADCVDVAADPAVVAAAQAGLAAARLLGQASANAPGLPWLMVSLNDGEDPHFRKASFDPQICPADCPRPCERVCPTAAIGPEGVTAALCYGCGRCLGVCPWGLIGARSHQADPATILPTVLAQGVVGLELHTQPGRRAEFGQLWQAIAPFLGQLRVVAVSCPDGEDLLDYLRSLWALMRPALQPALEEGKLALVWQTDGRPMSGDLGGGTTHAAIALGEKVLAAGLPGFVQLAGGTNDRTVDLLGDRLRPGNIAGVAYGGCARKRLGPVLEALEAIEQATQQPVALEEQPALLNQAIALARGLVDPLKTVSKTVR